jgi:hypothetical protein
MILTNKKGLLAILALLVSLEASAASFFDKPAPKTETAETTILPTKILSTKEVIEPASPPPEIIPAKTPEAAKPAPQAAAKPAPERKTRRRQRNDDAMEHIDTRDEINEMLMRRVRH